MATIPTWVLAAILATAGYQTVRGPITTGVQKGLVPAIKVTVVRPVKNAVVHPIKKLFKK